MILAAAVAIAVIVVDVASVAVLLPTIRLDLGSSSSGAAWVMGAHLLALAVLLPVAARFASGRRARALPVAGGLLMAVGAAVSATAGSTATLVTGRALQGAGAAAVLASLAGAPPVRPRIWFAATVALPAGALAFGPLVGGVFAELNWWHVYFWAGVPLAALAAGPALIAPRRGARPTPGRLRPLPFAAGLTAVTIALIQAEPWGGMWWVIPVVAGALLLSAARPRAPKPLEAMAAAAGACVVGLAFLLPEYLELVRRLSGLRSGALLLALTVPAVASWAIARVLAARLPERAPAWAGLVCAVAGLALLATIDPSTAYAVLLGSMVLVGTGLGVANGSVRGERGAERVVVWAGAGAAVGLAAASMAFLIGQARERDDGGSFEHALSTGVGWAACALILVLGVAAALAWRAMPASSPARPAGAS